jgi:hypothetical protein
MSDKRCPKSGKTAYPSYEAAIEAASRMQVLWSPVDAYECRCGQWHLTSMLQPDRPWRSDDNDGDRDDLQAARRRVIAERLSEIGINTSAGEGPARKEEA